MIEVKGVSKKYNDSYAVEDATVSIHKNRLTSLIGPNGAGKSTLLSMISRLLPMDQGEVFIDGCEVSQWKSHELAQTLSILKQSNHLNLRLTVHELVSFGRFPYSQGRLTPEDLDHVEHAIDTLDLGDLRDKFIDQLSGGERQRAFIAMVVAQNTDYILLDEPLNNLDMKHASHIMKTLRLLIEEYDKTIVVVVHDINVAAHYSDDIIAMKHGRVVEVGPTDNIIDPTVLNQVYDIDVQITCMGGKRFCHYFN